MIACSSEQAGEFASFDLDSQSDTIAGGQLDVVISYYETEADAIAGSNSISSPYVNLTNLQTIYARLTNDIGCYNTTSFELFVNPTPVANQPNSLKECNEGDGYAIYNLQAQIEQILDGQTNVDTTFYLTQSDAIDGVGSMSMVDIDAYTTLAGTIYVRVENLESGCYSLTSFDLFVENCIPDVPNGFSPNGDNMNEIFSIERLENVFYDYTMTIYNRWGNVVFEGNRNTGFWDGSVDGIISTDPTGATYFYVLNFNDGINAPLKGWVYVNP